MPSFTTKIIDNIEDFYTLQNSWDALLEQSPTRSAFLTWDWLYSWWKVYGVNKVLFIITIWDDKHVVAIAPLMLEKRHRFGIKLRTLVNIGTPQSDVGGFIYNATHVEVVRLIFNSILQNKKYWDLVELNEIASENEECNLINRFKRDFKLVLREEKNTHYIVSLDSDWDIFSKKLSKKFMHNLRRALKLSEAMGVVEIKHYTKEKVNHALLQEIIELNRHSNYPRLYNSKEEQNLLCELILNAKDNFNWLDVYILRINNQAVAYEYGFVYERKFESWRAGYNLSMPTHISIGKLLSMQVVQKCIQENYTEIDFLRGEEAYKQEWKPSSILFKNIRIFNDKSMIAMSAYFWLEHLKPLMQSLSKKRGEAEDKVTVG